MTEFLSPEWIAQLDAAARASAAIAALGVVDRFVVQQTVTATPRGDVTYHLVVDERGVCVTVGPAVDPDISLRTNYPTAVAILRGNASAQHVLPVGAFEVAGDVSAVVRRADVLRAIGDVFSATRSETVVPEDADL